LPPSESSVLHERRGMVALEWVLRLLVGLLAFQFFFLQSYQVQGKCMEPNVYTGDRLWGSNLGLLAGVKRGDVVVFAAPEEPSRYFIKRVVALPGETVEIRGREVLVNGEKLPEKYLRREWRDSLPPTRLGKESVWVMGDNRDQSNDSRLWGELPLSRVRGRALFRYWPPSRAGLLP